MCAHNRRRKGNHMQKNEILTAMNRLRDAEYGIFQAKLIPHLPPEMFLGVRTPDLRQLAKALAGTDAAAQFLQTLPHHYFDENQLHAFLVSRQKDFDICIAQTEAFLPYVDNWATCDQFSPAVFGRQKRTLVYGFDGGDPLTREDGGKMIRPDSQITPNSRGGLTVDCYDGKTRDIKLQN